MDHEIIKESERIKTAKTQEVGSPAVGYVPMSDDERRWILGRPCFVLASTARRLRKLGHKIETSAEDEQAVVIDWMLWMYKKYGKSWRDKIEEELK